MPRGPVQIVVIGFPESGALEDLGAEIRKVHDAPGVRLIDVLSVSKAHDGSMELIEVQTLPDVGDGERGAVVTALTGITAGDPEVADELEGTGLTQDDIWFADDAIPPGTSATLVLLEHEWAADLRDHVLGAGGSLLAEAWVHPSDLESAGI
jgi:uncharacterized membrane protein